MSGEGHFHRVLGAAVADARRSLKHAAGALEREAGYPESRGVGSMSTHSIRADLREVEEHLRKVEQGRAQVEAIEAVSGGGS